MASTHVNVAVTGAAGQISYSLLFRLASGEVFGSEVVVNLRLIELPRSLAKLEGLAMELHDCGFATLGEVTCTDSLAQGMSGANWVILVGAVPRKQGMERADLLAVNGGIFTEQGKAINDHAASDVRVLVVGNPCNTNALIACHHAPDIDNERFFAMTMLDELRARGLLAQKAGVPVSQVRQMAIWGNHSATQFPDVAHALIGDQAVTEVIQDQDWLQQTFLSTVQQRGAAIIQARGASSAASAANAIVRNIQALINDTPQGECFSVCVVSQGEYGVDAGLVYSLPCRVEHGELVRLVNWEHDAWAQAKLEATLQELRAEREAVVEAGLLS